MRLESILKDKDVMDNLSSLLEKHAVGGEIEFDDTEMNLRGTRRSLTEA